MRDKWVGRSGNEARAKGLLRRKAEGRQRVSEPLCDGFGTKGRNVGDERSKKV